MPFTDRTPDAITTETFTVNNKNPQISYRFDLSHYERIVIAKLLEDDTSMVGSWLHSLMSQPDANLTITLSVPNEA